MDGLVIPFVTQVQLPPRNVPSSACWAGITTLEVDLYFDVPMVTGSVPEESSFEIIVDGDKLPALDIEWDGQHLEMDVDHVPPVTSLTVQLLHLDPGLRQVNGGVMTAAFKMDAFFECV